MRAMAAEAEAARNARAKVIFGIITRKRLCVANVWVFSLRKLSPNKTEKIQTAVDLHPPIPIPPLHFGEKLW